MLKDTGMGEQPTEVCLVACQENIRCREQMHVRQLWVTLQVRTIGAHSAFELSNMTLVQVSRRFRLPLYVHSEGLCVRPVK